MTGPDNRLSLLPSLNKGKTKYSYVALRHILWEQWVAVVNAFVSETMWTCRMTVPMFLLIQTESNLDSLHESDVYDNDGNTESVETTSEFVWSKNGQRDIPGWRSDSQRNAIFLWETEVTLLCSYQIMKNYPFGHQQHHITIGATTFIIHYRHEHMSRNYNSLPRA